MPSPTALLGPLARHVVDATGEDRASYMDAVLSQRLRDAVPGTATGALELGPHGEPTGVLELAVLDDRIVLLVAPTQLAGVLARLSTRTFLSDASFTRRDDLTGVRLRGDEAHAVAAAAGLATRSGQAVLEDGVLRLGWRHGVDLVGAADDLTVATAALSAAGAVSAGERELDAAELASGVPRAPEEIALGRLPEEMGLLPTHVHLAKGCYPGQEAVARMWMLGRPRRRLAVLDVPPAIAAPGPVGDGRDRVELTRIVEPDVAGAVAAAVRTLADVTAAERVLALGFVPAGVEPGDEPQPGVRVLQIVGAGLPVPGHDPAMTRRRDR